MANEDVSDDELDALRRRRMAEMQERQQVEAQKQHQEDQAKAQLESALKQILTVEAWDQWNNAKFSNEQNAYSAAVALLKASQSGQLKGKVTKEELKGVLSKISNLTTREFKIKRL